MNSPFHVTINEIRSKYASKKVSILDLYEIERAYNLCSVVNIRNNDTAFLRITSFGLDEIMFEDIVLNLNFIQSPDSNDAKNIDFQIKSFLYLQAYGVDLQNDSSIRFINEIDKPTLDFKNDKEEVARLKAKCDQLEKEIQKLKSSSQPSLFDMID